MPETAATFEKDQIGAAPTGWTAALTGKGSSKWTVETDATPLSKSRVLKQSGQATFPLLLKDDTCIAHGFLEIRFKAVGGSADRAAGLVWRARDANNYYVVRANALEDNVVLYKTVNGVRSALDIVGRTGGYGVAVPVLTDRWHGLRIDFEGSRFKASYNGTRLFEVEDSTFKDAGQVGLWAKADSETLFDQITYGEAK